MIFERKQNNCQLSIIDCEERRQEVHLNWANPVDLSLKHLFTYAVFQTVYNLDCSVAITLKLFNQL